MPRLQAVVEATLALRWSPQQIAGWRPLADPQDPVLGVSPETIYLSLFIQSRGALRHQLHRCLRSGRAMRDPRAKRLPQGEASCLTYCLSASDRRRWSIERCLALGKAI